MSQMEIPNRQQLLTASDWGTKYDEEGNVTGYELRGADGGAVSTITSTMGPEYVGPTTRANPFGDGTYEMNWGENNAMTEILNRGKKADGTWNIGWMQGLSQNNITQEQMNDFAEKGNYDTLAGLYNKDLVANGQAPVSFGEGEASVTRRLNQAIGMPDARRLEAQRVEGLQGSQLAQANAGIRIDNTDASALQEKAELKVERENIRSDAATSEQRGRDFQMGMQELKNDAEMKRYDKELDRFDRESRKDSITALIAGLATLGAGFAM